jgi:hypothetical protein
MRPSITLILWVVALALIALSARRAAAYERTDAYRKRVSNGFTALISPEADRHKRELEEALKELDAQLQRVAKVVPEQALAELRKTQIWIEWDNPRDKTAEFHESAGWLRKNGYNPDKAGGVEIGNIVRFVKWSREDQPWMVFHELAHRYHSRVLGEDHAGVRDAYRHAMDAKLYDAVAYVHGGKPRKAYAAGNAKEYFAELSECYFGNNDYFPFTRDDLAKHDPEGYRLMQSVWGDAPEKADAPEATALPSSTSAAP